MHVLDLSMQSVSVCGATKAQQCLKGKRWDSQQHQCLHHPGFQIVDSVILASVKVCVALPGYAYPAFARPNPTGCCFKQQNILHMCAALEEQLNLSTMCEEGSENGFPIIASRLLTC